MVWLKLSVILFLVCAVQCSLMSNDELEDFQNFLKKTSQLDQTIRKGVDPDEDEDEDEAASDHAWEDSGKFEGDLILNDRQRRVIVQDVAEGLSRNGLRDSTKRWPNNEVIYYIQKDHFSGAQVEAIQNGIDDLAQASCIKFRPYKKGDRDAVVIQGSRRGCFSQVGYQSGYQVLNLSGRHPVGRGCFRHGTVVHELLHTLGFYHMQSSPDRDDFIDVVWENIRKQARHNFRKYNMFSVSDFGVGYDYNSVLHYSRRAFSTNGQDTLVPKKSGAEIGQRVRLSDKDTQKLNKMYCDADSDSNNADEDNTSKPLKKKKPKNKPFDGHGIGYHQGKTVVIKLLPAPETYKLPDVPSFHVFDYFSKAPQALSTPSEIAGFRIGKEIIYPYHSPATVKTEEYSKPQQFTVNAKGEDWKNDDKTTSANTEQYKKPQQDTVNVNSENWSHDDKIISGRYNDTSRLLQDKFFTNADENLKDSPLKEYKPITASETLGGDLSDAFDSLTKIIKSHVYPSQTPNLNIYKIHKAHIELFNPSNYSEEKQVDGTLQEHTEKMKTGIEIITEIYDRSSIIASDTVNNSENVEDKKETDDSQEKHSLSSDDTVNPNKHNFYQGYPYRSFSYGVRGPFNDEYVAQKYESPEDDEDDDDEHEGYKGFEYYKEDNKSKEGPKSLFEDLRYKLYSEDSYRKPVFGRRFDDLRSTVHTPYTLQRSPYMYDDGDEAYGSSSDGQDTRSLFGFPGSSEQKWGESDYSKGKLDLSSNDHSYR